MCGLVALVNKENGKFPVDLFRSLLVQARIRGQHATGVAYITDSLKSVNESVPAVMFDIPKDMYDAKVAIGHTRYSTSSLDWNQPVTNGHGALIHNGVVTQSLPKYWFGEFGVRCKTENDSEILMHMIQIGHHPLTLKNTSQACVYVSPDYDVLRFWRNEERPLYYMENDEFFVVASTKDIMTRAGWVDGTPIECKPGVEYRYITKSTSPSRLSSKQIVEPSEDLQHGEFHK
jgi:glutamine phosphoribosylpyrophosphate amidotransferase